MIVAQSVSDLKREIARLRASGQTIAFVPTMGNLHAGHARLMEAARTHADAVVASIYVNPLQFGPKEDFAAYPRTPEADRELLTAAGVDLLFFPGDAAIYPRGREASTRIEVPDIGGILCGASRPGHFVGVATVVSRLFHLVTPDAALFGKKDYQQLLVIRLMAEDMGLPVEIVGVDTVRAPDGLALSSRNNYLSQDERRLAPQLYACLQTLAGKIRNGDTNKLSQLEEEAVQTLAKSGFRPDYVSIRKQSDLGIPLPGERMLVILAAAWLGRTRLIDNLEVALNPAS